MAADPLSRVFSALADPTRRDMVARLAVGDATVNELAEPYDVTVQAVSKHLKVLEDAGLVSRTREAQRRPVHLEAEVFDLMTKWIERYRRQAEERYRRLDDVLRSMPDDVEPTPPTTRDRSTDMTTSTHETEITVDPDVPLVRIIREFDAPPEKVFRAHTDPELVVQWTRARAASRCGSTTSTAAPAGRTATCTRSDGNEYGFHGCFHEVRPAELIVQTFTFEGMPDGVALERLVFEDLGDGRTRLTATSLVDSFEDRDAVRGQRHGGRRPRGLRAPRRAAGRKLSRS